MQTETMATEWTMPISKELFVRLYADTRPHHQLTARLQKGLILISKEQELAGEGIGIGVPAVRCKDRTYFSGISTVRLEQTRSQTKVIKNFTLNLTTERILRNIQLETTAVRKIRRSFDNIYMKHRHLRSLTFEKVLMRFGINRDFLKTKPVGNVTITYKINPPQISIEAEFSLFHENNLQKIYLLNEQSSKHFRKYYDSSGTVLFDNEIGAWEPINAEWACIYSAKNNVGIRLWQNKGAIWYRGREFLSGVIDWIGLDYEANPDSMSFEYDVELVRSQLKP